MDTTRDYVQLAFERQSIALSDKRLTLETRTYARDKQTFGHKVARMLLKQRIEEIGQELSANG